MEEWEDTRVTPRESSPRRPIVAALSRVAAAVALTVSASMAMPPPSAHAGRASASSSQTMSSQAEKRSDELLRKFNVNVVQLPEQAQTELSMAMQAAGVEIQVLALALTKMIQDPWAVEDVWLIVLWYYAHSKGRRALYNALNNSRRGTADKDGTGETEKEEFEAEAADAKAYAKSFLSWLGGPMKVIGAVWITLYLRDTFATMFMLGRGFNIDIGMYVIALGAVVAMFIGRWLPEILERRAGIEEPAVQLIATRLMTIAIVLVTIVVAGSFFGVPPQGILGLGGVGGLTFGLAAKDLLSNLLGGTMIALLRPFTIGEEIFITAQGNFRGSNDPSVSDYLVQSIGWYQTVLIAKDTKPTIVPNGFFLGANVINVSRYRARVVIMEYRIRYQDREVVPTLTTELSAFIKSHKAVNKKDYPVWVHLSDVEADHLRMEVQLHVYKMPLGRHKDVKQELIMGMLEILEKHTSGPAYPVELAIGHPHVD